MTNHEMLAFIYENGPCTHIDIDFEFGCGDLRIENTAFILMLFGFLDYDFENGLFTYSGDWAS